MHAGANSSPHLKEALSRAHTHPHTLFRPVTHTHTHTHIHCCIHVLTQTRSLCQSVTSTTTHTHTLSLSVTLTHTPYSSLIDTLSHSLTTHTHTQTHTHTHTHTHSRVKPDSQGKQLRHVTEAEVGQRADLVVTQIAARKTTTDSMTQTVYTHTVGPNTDTRHINLTQSSNMALELVHRYMHKYTHNATYTIKHSLFTANQSGA